MTHSSARIPHLVSFSVSIPSFVSPNRWFRPVSLSQLCSPCYRSVVLITKGDHPLSSSTRRELPSPRWLMSLRRGLSPNWQLLLSRNILMAPLLTKMLRVDPPVPPISPMPRRSSLVFLKCQRQSWIGQDNKRLNKALSLINERWRGLGMPLTASRR